MKFQITKPTHLYGITMATALPPEDIAKNILGVGSPAPSLVFYATSLLGKDATKWWKKLEKMYRKMGMTVSKHKRYGDGPVHRFLYYVSMDGGGKPYELKIVQALERDGVPAAGEHVVTDVHKDIPKAYRHLVAGNAENYWTAAAMHLPSARVIHYAPGSKEFHICDGEVAEAQA